MSDTYTISYRWSGDGEHWKAVVKTLDQRTGRRFERYEEDDGPSLVEIDPEIRVALDATGAVSIEAVCLIVNGRPRPMV